MRLSIDETLIEASVALLIADGNSGIHPFQIKRFQMARERVYSVLDPDARADAFQQLFLAWFREWELDQRFKSVIDTFPLISKHLEVLAIRKARRASEEGAEMYVNSEHQKNGVIAVLPPKVIRSELLAPFLNHELMHLNDMVDPAFGYSLDFFNFNSSQQNLVIKRYRVLWDVAIDGRLTQAGKPTLQSREQRLQEFERAFSFFSQEIRERIFEELWRKPCCHQQLLEILLKSRGSGDADHPIPGSACPLCRFPTFEWMETAVTNPEVIRKIRVGFPEWVPSQRICFRCNESFDQPEMLHSQSLFLG